VSCRAHVGERCNVELAPGGGEEESERRTSTQKV
jgi:hypothetical protein